MAWVMPIVLTDHTTIEVDIEREITALEQGQPSPIVEEYLTAEERDLRGV